MLLWFVIVYWLISVGIGLLAATRVHNTKDFAVAGRHLPFYMVTATVFATWFGSETVLGIPATFLNEGLHGVVADPFGSSMCLILVGLFFAANVPKIVQGGAFPVLAGIVLFVLMTTWRRGKQLLVDRLDESALPLPLFISSIRVQPPHRVKGTAVFLTADPMVVRMADACPGKVIFFASDRNHPVMAMHRAQGKRIIYLDGDAIVAEQGEFKKRLELADIPVTANGTIGFQIENAMASIGAGWALGLDWRVIRNGLASFVNDATSAPGRFNLFDYRGATLIADYGHNPDAILALVQAVETMPAKRRSVVISGAGDRRDEDIREQTRILGKVFDDVVLYQDECQRGRADGEVLALLQQGLVDAPRTRDIVEIRGEFLAIDTALSKLQPGDLCLILIDQVEEALEHIARRIAETQA